MSDTDRDTGPNASEYCARLQRAQSRDDLAATAPAISRALYYADEPTDAHGWMRRALWAERRLAMRLVELGLAPDPRVALPGVDVRELVSGGPRAFHAVCRDLTDAEVRDVLTAAYPGRP